MLTAQRPRAEAIEVGSDELADAPLASYVDGDAWICIFCTWRNDLGAAACAHCGLSFVGGRPRSDLPAPSRGLQAINATHGAAAEAAIGLGLFAAYRLGDIVSGRHTAGAAERGRRLWDLERALYLPSEHGLQGLVLPHASALHALDVYYAVGHLGGLAVAAAWLFRRHRADYGRWRSAVVLTTTACFAVQLVAVAPPRSVSGLGMVDVATRLHESVYAHSQLANQVSAFPSVHMAWAVLVAAMVVSVARGRRRVLVTLHPLLTLVAIVATANHYWLDAAAAVGIAVVATLATRTPARSG